MAEARVLEATTSFVVGTTVVHKGDTAEEGAAVTVGREAFFRPLQIRHKRAAQSEPAPAPPKPPAAAVPPPKEATPPPAAPKAQTPASGKADDTKADTASKAKA